MGLFCVNLHFRATDDKALSAAMTDMQSGIVALLRADFGEEAEASGRTVLDIDVGLG